jgi:hypothetical protein
MMCMFQFAMAECFLSGITDQFPNFFKRGKRRKMMLLILYVIAQIIIGLLFCTRVGSWLTSGSSIR